jgi:hypothetical protein
MIHQIQSDDLADFFLRPIAFHRCLVRVGGSVTAGLLLSQALYWQGVKDRKGAGGWFYKTGAEWLEETGLSREELETARRRLVDRHLLDYAVRGVPAKGHYRVRFEQLLASLRDSRKLDCGKAGDLDAGKKQTGLRQSPELLTTEINSETTHKSSAGRIRDTAHEGFQKIWKAYPIRAGNNPRSRAMRAYVARIGEGHTATEMLQGVERYARFCEATGKAGGEYVLQAATFLGSEKLFLQSWSTAGGTPNWRSTEDGIRTKATDVGLALRPGESWKELEQRINHKLNQNAQLH